MFPWDDARFFLAIHRTGSLSAAGRKLGVNQSTVSRRLAALEERLDARLFVRTPDGYVASPAGERLIPHAERMEDLANAIAREVTGHASSLTGTVRITAPDALGSVFLVPILASFRERHPQIELEVVAENRIFSLTKREADMALRIAPMREPRLVARQVAKLGNGVYASRAYIASRGRPRGDDFAGHDVIGFDEALQGTLEARWLAARSKNARTSIRTSSTHAQLWAAISGMGFAVLPCYLADPKAELVRLRRVVTRQVWLVLHPDLRHAARIRTTADFLVEALAARRAELAGTARSSFFPARAQ